jgi:thioredoxin reductase
MEVGIFGEPMSFWENRMPLGMCLRSSWDASHIADPRRQLTMDAYCREVGREVSRPIPLQTFVGYGQWFQQKVVPNVDRRQVRNVEQFRDGFKLTLQDGELFTSRRVIVATGIGSFSVRPEAFREISSELASHSSEQKDLGTFKGLRVAVIGSGQSALESAALLHEAGSEVEVIARRESLNWVGLHPKLHRLGFISKILYSNRDVGPAGISRLVAMPHVFRRFPRAFQNRAAYRAIRPAVAGWVRPRLQNIPIMFGRCVISAKATGKRIKLTLNDHTERTVDHVLLATGYRVDVSRYRFLSESLLRQLKLQEGFPVLGRGMESSVPGLYFIGKPAAWSFGPILGFVSGAEFASTEIIRGLTGRDSIHSA